MNQQQLAKIREDMESALEEFYIADREWNEINDAFTRKIIKENARRKAQGRPRHSALSVAQQKNDTLVLTEAMDKAKWFRDKAATLAAVLNAELAHRQLRGS